MNFGGIQKLSLLDYPDRTCCTLFTMGCNYRCPFCHNSSIITGNCLDSEITQHEVMEFLKKRGGLLDGVCITGGEPLMHDKLEDFIREVRYLGFSVKLDTNGSYPDRLKNLVENKLVDYVAMDIKNSMDRYGETAGVKYFDIEPIKESVDYLLSSPVDYEFRTTVVRGFHTEKEFLSIANWIKGAKHYYIQHFVDSQEVLVSGLEGCSKEEMLHFMETVKPIIPSVEIRGL